MELRDEFVSRFPSFSKSLATEELEVLVGALPLRRLKDGEVLLTDGDPAGAAYLLLEGAIRIVLSPGGTRLDAGELEPGTWIGEVSLLDGGPATATAIATAPSRVLSLARPTLEQLRDSHPRVASVLLREMTLTIARRVRQSSNQLEKLRAALVTNADLPREELFESLRTLMGARELK